MKRLLLIASALILAGTASSFAQAATTTTAQTAAKPAEPAKAETAQVDSPLVRAAKTSRAGKKKKSIVIDDAYLKANSGKGRLSEAAKVARPLPVMPPGDLPPVVHAPPTDADFANGGKAATEKKLKDLQAEQARLANEMEDPNGGETNDPEGAAKRLKEIEAEIQKMNPEPGRRP